MLSNIDIVIDWNFDIDQHDTIRYIDIEMIYRDIWYFDTSLQHVRKKEITY